MDAVVYTSSTGSTEQYARLLGAAAGLPVYALSDAEGAVPRGGAVLYLGWLMAGTVKGYREAAARFSVRAVCAVGIGGAAQEDAVRTGNRLGDTPLFILPGAFDLERLHGAARLMMRMMRKSLAKRLEAKPERTEEETAMLHLLEHGGSLVDEQHLAPVLAWLASAGRPERM